jgi:predicted nuclease of predicted toxin-antitoxin system
MKVPVDMNLSPRWAALLGDAGFHSEHGSSVGAASATDARIMYWAADRGYVVLTNDLDFGAILAASQGIKPSVVQARADNLNPDVTGPTVLAAQKATAGDLATGALVTVEPSRNSVMLLPLQRT